MASQLVRLRSILTVLLGLALSTTALSEVATAHPMGNFSINHYSGLTVHPNRVEIRYLLDMAEIPTFQEIQNNGIVAEAGHPSLDGYLGDKSEALKDGLVLQINGERVPLRVTSKTILWSPGAGGLPTMKLGLVLRAPVPDTLAPRLNQLSYEDRNFSDRAGWKEIVAESGPGIALAVSSVPEQDRSRQLSDYPTDLMNSPPQVVQAALAFALDTPVGPVTASVRPTALPERGPDKPARSTTRRAVKADLEPSRLTSLETPAPSPTQTATLELQTNRQASRRDRFTDLIGSGPTGPGIIFFAALVAATLGAFHALEPGHGKTVVAAYLVGSRGTARHAMLLGLIVTASHTAGVYLLGAVTLYASRYIVPERLYPWLGAVSGLTIAVLGFCLFLKRYARPHEHGHSHDASDHDHAHSHDHGDGHHHDHEHHHHGHHHHGHHHHHQVPSGTKVSLKELLALGVTGGIVPCPAALVVLLSAVALRRIGFGLFLIVAFSVGLAAVLIAIGLLTVYARRLMARDESTGPLITRWLPLTSSVTVTVLGIAIAAQALINAGILTIRLG